MKDTSHPIQQILRAEFRALTPEARIRMATGMFSAARELFRAGTQTDRTLVGAQGERWLRRLYSAELSPAVLDAVARRLTEETSAGAPGETDPGAHDAPGQRR